MIQEYGLVQEHDGDVVSNRIQDFPILPHEPFLDVAFNPLASTVAQNPFRHGQVHPFQGAGVRKLQRLLRLRAHENLQELWIQHGRPGGTGTLMRIYRKLPPSYEDGGNL